MQKFKYKAELAIFLGGLAAYLLFVAASEAGIDSGVESGYTQGIGDSDNGAFFKATLAPANKPYYIWGQWEDTTTRFLGQPLADTEIISFGLGWKGYFTEEKRSYWFGEIGYATLDHSINHSIQQEIVYTELVDRHYKTNRPVPVGLPQDRPLLQLGDKYDQVTYETKWETKDGYTGAIGVGYEITKHLVGTLAYRPLFVREHIELYDEEVRASGGGWWQESRNRDYSTIQVGLRWDF